MQAIVQHGYGPPHDVLEPATVDTPTFGADDVLVRLRATSVNTPDWVAVTGSPRIIKLRMGLRRPSTPVRGTDIAGVVAAVGENVNSFQPGDEVFGSLWENSQATHPPGTFAEFTVAPAANLIAKPADLSFEEAAGSVMSGLTAMTAIRDVAQVEPGMSVLINGASGGVGTLAVQMAKFMGAEVTGVCGSSNVDLVRTLGADHVIDYRTADFTRGDAKYDVVLDNVLNHPPSVLARMLTTDGTLIPNSVGNSGGWFAGLPRMARAALLGLGRTNVKFVQYDSNQDNLTALADLLTSGNITVVIDSVHPLDNAADAVARMLSHRAAGNVIITI